MPVLYRAVLLAMLLLGIPAVPAIAQTAGALSGPDTRELVQADLIAEPAAVTPGQPFWVGVRLRMKEHWHTYWRNPGDSGLASAVDWRLPEGFAAGPIVWPAPQRLPVAHLVNFGYEGETLLLTEIVPPAAAISATSVSIGGTLSFLVCETICIPGEAELALTLPVAPPGQAAAEPASQATFAVARAALPQPAPWPVTVEAGKEVVMLQVAAAGLRADAIRTAFFFPHAETLIDHAAPQALTVDGNGLTLRMTPSRYGDGKPAATGGVLAVEEDIGGRIVRHAFAVAGDGAAAAGAVPAAAQALASASTPAPVPAPVPAGGLAAILQAMLFAFLGGIVLNLMPCVFPVLSIKVLALVAHSGESRARIRLHGLSYTAGVLAMFLLLAGILLAVRAAGAQVGWGYQLQSPVVIALLVFLLFAMGLNLSGVYSFGGGLSGIGGGLAQRGGLAGSFFTGSLATVVATPCTAPFMGAAVGFALTQPAATGLVVFASLGFGLAAPFLLLTLVPGLAARLPRPGGWMEVLRQLLAFPLYATVVWLVWVLSQQTGPDGLLAALGGLVLVALAAWALGLAQQHGGRPGPRRWAQGTALAALAGLAGLAMLLAQAAPRSAGPATAAAPAAAAAGAAIAYSPARLDALLAEGRPVFVNMTAAWCITCLVNERTALSADSVQAALAAGNIAYVKGDWTNRDPAITALLERHGRSGVPLYLFYAGGGAAPVVLPQILTPAIVLEHIGRATAALSRQSASIPTPAGSVRP